MLSSSSAPLQLRFALEEGAKPPTRAHTEDAGLDLSVHRFTRRGATLFFFDMGVRIEPPAGYYCELIPRSSIVWRGWIMPNSVGVIDPGYRGKLMAPLLYLGEGEAEAEAEALVGERVVQLVLRALYPTTLEEVSIEQLSDSARGEGRFGSSGGRFSHKSES